MTTVYEDIIITGITRAVTGMCPQIITVYMVVIIGDSGGSRV